MSETGRGMEAPPLFALFTEARRETVRKGYEQRFETRFGRYTGAAMDRKAPLWRPAGLRYKCVRDFSDSLRRGVLGSSQPLVTP